MKKLIVSALVACFLASAALAAGPDARMRVTIPSGTTVVTQQVFSGMAMAPDTVMRLDSWSMFNTALTSNLTVAVRMIGATYTNDCTAVASTTLVAGTPYAFTIKQAVGASDYLVVTLGATNATATQVYVSLMP
jgi:hypothetical protein